MRAALEGRQSEQPASTPEVVCGQRCHWMRCGRPLCAELRPEGCAASAGTGVKWECTREMQSWAEGGRNLEDMEGASVATAMREGS